MNDLVSRETDELDAEDVNTDGGNRANKPWKMNCLDGQCYYYYTIPYLMARRTFPGSRELREHVARKKI